MTLRIAALVAVLCLVAPAAEAAGMHGGHGGGHGAHGGQSGHGGAGHGGGGGGWGGGGWGGHGGGGWSGRGGWGHGGCGHHGFHGHSSVFIGGFFWDPFWYPGYYPYVAPYYYPYYGSYGYPYGPPPPYTDAPDYGEQEDDRNVARSEETEDPMRASYGLVQLRGVPDGAQVELDGRQWLTAQALDRRWLALPHGSHTLVVRVDDREPVERRVDVSQGGNQVVRFSIPRSR